MRANRPLLATIICGLTLTCAAKQTTPTTAATGGAPVVEPEREQRPRELKDPGQQFVLVVSGLVEVITGFDGDCDQTLTAATTWIAEHRQEVIEIEKRMRAKFMSLEDDERERYSDQLEALLQELVGDIDRVMDRFESECPEHSDRFVEQMDFLDIDYL